MALDPKSLHIKPAGNVEEIPAGEMVVEIDGRMYTAAELIGRGRGEIRKIRLECLVLACQLAQSGTADVTIKNRAATFEDWVMRDQEKEPPESTTD